MVKKIKEQAPRSRERLIRDSIDEYFKGEHPEDIADIVDEVKVFVNKKIQMENALGTREKHSQMSKLEPIDIVNILSHVDNYKTIKRAEKSTRDSAELMYQNSDGWYENAEEHIEDICSQIAPHIDGNKLKEVFRLFRVKNGAPVSEESNPDYVPLANGIFDKKTYQKTGKLIPYSSDVIITNPIRTGFNPKATNPKVKIDGKTFDIEKWLLELAGGSDETREFLWKVISAALHPYRRYNKAVFLYSPFGNNGKGTFTQLLENLVGQDNTVHMAIEEFADKFLPTALLSARLIIGDESNVDDYFSKAKNFKLAVTGDTITVDRKYKEKVELDFHGLIVECVNSLPSTKDKTDSFYRRLITVPFTARFEGKENKAIKSEYIYNQKVLEYILHKALMLDVDDVELVAPKEATELLETYKEQNNTVLQWWNDEGSQVDYAWDSVPFCLLYGSYKWWCKNNTVKQDVSIGSRKFEHEFVDCIMPKLDGWEVPSGNYFTVGKRFKESEPLIGKYAVEELRNPNYAGSDWNKVGSDGGQYKPQYRGIRKKGS